MYRLLDCTCYIFVCPLHCVVGKTCVSKFAPDGCVNPEWHLFSPALQFSCLVSEALNALNAVVENKFHAFVRWCSSFTVMTGNRTGNLCQNFSHASVFYLYLCKFSAIVFICSCWIICLQAGVGWDSFYNITESFCRLFVCKWIFFWSQLFKWWLM